VLHPAALSNLLANGYVGSATCASCHARIFARWKNTRMANVVQDPKVHPDAVVADFSKPNPLVTFKKDEIAFTYGSKWNNDISPNGETTTMSFRRSGTSAIVSGELTARKPGRIGGSPCVQRTRCSVLQGRSATDVIR